MDNTGDRGNFLRGENLGRAVVARFGASLPDRWEVSLGARNMLRLSVGGVTAQLRTRVTPRLSPRDAKALGQDEASVDLVLARFLTPLAQERLRENQIAYIDLTGNAYLALERPFVFVRTSGADTDPDPPLKRASLNGAKAGSVVRALADFVSPVGIRELAARARVTPGYASRLVAALAEEALLERTPRGPVVQVDVPRLLRRWSDYYTWSESNRVRPFLDPRGASSSLKKLGSRRYAVTGSFGAAALAPVAAPRLLSVYIDDIEQVAGSLRLRPADAGANVLLAEPFDPVVYDRTWHKNGVVYAAPSQLAVDLMGSPGRGPNEAEELLRWMGENEDAWRVR